MSRCEGCNLFCSNFTFICFCLGGKWKDICCRTPTSPDRTRREDDGGGGGGPHPWEGGCPG